MAVFFIYVPDGREYSMTDMEYSANAEVVRRELAARVRTGVGVAHYLSEMEEVSADAARAARLEEEWPDASDRALMVVWRCRGREMPDGTPNEIWRYSGNVDRPYIEPLTVADMADLIEAFGERKTLDGWMKDKRARVSLDVYQRRVQMGWDPERALSTPMIWSPSGLQRTTGTNLDQLGQLEGGRGSAQWEVYTAFDLTRSIPEWSELTGITDSALRSGARKHGMEEYLRKRQWHPGRRTGR